MDKIASPDPKRPADRLYPCKICGQIVDRVDLDAVFYHDDRPHEPKPPKGASQG